MCNRTVPLVLSVGVLATALELGAEEANYDEAQVPSYSLPDPLVGKDGRRVTSADEWNSSRREEILRLFESEVYGVSPPELPVATVKLDEPAGRYPHAKGIRRKQVTIELSRAGKVVELHLLIYLPDSSAPVPAFLGLNFKGNHTVANDGAIRIANSWKPTKDKTEFELVPSSEARGSTQSRWPIEDIVSRGYAVATVYYGDIDPDFDDGFHNGVHALYADEERGSASWGSIAAWAWGLSRIMDYLTSDSDLDAEQIAVMGHSRLGKTALWAGATDERFSLVVSNDSGCGGAALSRRAFGETVGRINTSFPHWFCRNFRQYNGREEACPIDQHMLISLIAPRPVLICSAEEDRWADPKGEFLSGKNADAVYKLLGSDGMAAEEMPQVNQPVMSRIGYHIRPGKHDVKLEDWQVYLDFADQHFNR